MEQKTVFRYFTIPQYQQEEAFLISMHRNGWKLTGITFPGFYHFDKCEPQKVAYRLDYNQEGMKNKAEYVQIFSDCGWEYLFDFVGYSYFRKKDGDGQEPEEIFCDDSSRLDMMKRVLKGRMPPLIALFLCVLLPQLAANVLGYGGGGLIQDICSITFLVLALSYLALFGILAYQFYQYEKKLSPEKTGVAYKYWGISLLLLFLALCIGIFFYFSKRSVYSVYERTDNFTVEAGQLNKSVSATYRLRKGDTITAHHDYSGGELSIRIGEEGQKPIFLGNSYHKIEDFTIKIQQDGHYKIECSGRGAKGTIRFAIQQQ